MRTHAESAQDITSSSMASDVSQKQNRGGFASQILDDRPEAASQRQLHDMANNSPRMLQFRALQSMADTRLRATQTSELQASPNLNTSRQTLQRQVPLGGEAVKPVPDAGSYVARGGQNVAFDKHQHPRGHFQFGSKTRYEVFEGFNPQKWGNRIISVRATNGEQMNVEAIQLDHRRSWNLISDVMHDHNQQPGRIWTYSLWDAKMYYNDQPNLHPAPANLNAAAGALGVEQAARLHYGLESGVGDLQTAWLNLQQTLDAMSPSIGENAVDPIWHRLNTIRNEMNTLSVDLIGANW